MGLFQKVQGADTEFVKSRFGLTMLTIVGFAVLLTAGFLVQQHLTTRAFDRLEGRQVSEHAERVRVALEYEMQMTGNYGATNSIWDDTYGALESGDPQAMADAFQPQDIQKLFGVDGVLAVGLDGEIRNGGFAKAGQSEFAPAPSGFGDAATLRSLFDPNAPAGTGACGILRAGDAYIYCGYASYKSDSTGPVEGGLIYLKSLGQDGVKALGDRSKLALSLHPGDVRDRNADVQLESTLGSIGVVTYPVSESEIAMDLTVPVKNGDPLAIQVIRDRPIHEQAGKTGKQMILVVGGIGIGLLAMVLVLQSRVIKGRIRSLRRSVDEIKASSDTAMRTGLDGGDEIGLLAKSVDEMLETISAQASELQASQAEREARQAEREAEMASGEAERERARKAAQALISETSREVVSQLGGVASEVDVVRDAASNIDSRIAIAAQMTRQVVDRTEEVGSVVSALDGSTTEIEAVTQLIISIAEQTNMLALNATIEAARAGEAGKGFAVVASEVKELASSTATATANINKVISSIRHDSSAVAAVMTDVVEAIRKVNEVTGEVSGATGEQRAAVDALSSQLRESMQRIEALSSRNNSAAEQRFGVKASY